MPPLLGIRLQLGRTVTELLEASILATVRDFITQEFLYMRPDFNLADDDDLLRRGVIDSMGVMELLEFIQSSFAITIADSEVTETNLGSLRAIAKFVTAKRALD